MKKTDYKFFLLALLLSVTGTVYTQDVIQTDTVRNDIITVQSYLMPVFYPF